MNFWTITPILSQTTSVYPSLSTFYFYLPPSINISLPSPLITSPPWNYSSTYPLPLSHSQLVSLPPYLFSPSLSMFLSFTPSLSLHLSTLHPLSLTPSLSLSLYLSLSLSIHVCPFPLSLLVSVSPSPLTHTPSITPSISLSFTLSSSLPHYLILSHTLSTSFSFSLCNISNF